MKKKKIFLWLSGSIVAFVALVMITNATGKERFIPTVSAKSMTIYKSPTCGCCANYVLYMKRAGYDVRVVDTENMAKKKNEYGIPPNMESCHTTVIENGEYIVEGHIPTEGIEALLADDSDVRTIALPDMPVGSPGMPGKKREAFSIYAIDAQGSIVEYMQL
ncbi:MAG: hypothetical protein CO030_01350 [Candidatus Magasanikbacteria bacterium CG_4_9_14_0_2_um_filter_42_11]|uniref:CopG family transcriptional regulator n=1 Tax=Candidatus Magasanikbacteria bacterium CG_4_9_14_0_2_um_filter_42_11 TaxID=1974643 RepID=A0A2M8FAG9_9BACT|nr:MAG: hypothetical protein COY70_01540 [Candidatus Magasanikbacteria bacterium CG_4_10_14_0_8_um_filter_42_12]PJC52733.1 MAG: hypothetical protein CO030_01350 [Candidatus Magasanikbacteria bacterium CG_4_9_14_0_2_um_filter_42_11]